MFPALQTFFDKELDKLGNGFLLGFGLFDNFKVELFSTLVGYMGFLIFKEFPYF